MRRALWLPLVLAACARLDDVPTDEERETPPVCAVRAPVAPLVVATLPAALVEVSGIVASPSGQDVWWMHNDSGDVARLIAVGRDGARVAEVALTDVALVDAEDIGAGPCPDGVGRCLVVADTGDNLRDRVDAHLVFVREPTLDVTTLEQAIVGDVVIDVPIGFEEGPVDVEAIALAPDGGRVVLVEKVDAARARVYVVETPFRDDARNLARLVGDVVSPGLPVPLGRAVTAIDVHPSARALVMRTYTGVFEFVVAAPAVDDAGLVRLLSAVPARVATGPLREPQGEAVAYDLDGTTVLLASEVLVGGGGQPLLAVPCCSDILCLLHAQSVQVSTATRGSASRSRPIHLGNHEVFFSCRPSGTALAFGSSNKEVPMHRQPLRADTGAWTVQVWVAFIVALGATSVGVLFLNADVWVRGFLFLGLYFTVSSTMSLSKALRDRHESDKLVSKLDEAHAERTLREVYRDAA